MRILVNPLDKDSISQAIKLVKQYKEEFAVNEREFVRRLAEIGVSVAQVGFAVADYDGTKDVAVTMNHEGNKATITAMGKTVGFVEFGTGVRYPEWDGHDTEYTPPPHGSYGKGHGKWKHGWWFVPNEGVTAQHTYGNPPAEAMLTARNTVIERVTQIAREVWR